MNAFERRIRTIIEAEGPLPLSRYMTLCLSDPHHGYYTTRDPLGVSGDFTTAPEISQMFGELIGLWCAEVWRAMSAAGGAARGAPQRLHLAELGPGRGTLMKDLLRAAKIVPDFLSAIDVHLVETSPVLAGRQRETLANAHPEISWHTRVEELPEGPLIVVANEFVDALPIDQFVKTQDGWRERRIGIVDGKLAFGLDPRPVPGIDESLPPRLRKAFVDSVLERRELGPVREIATRIAKAGGAALIVDYGHRRTTLAHTLQAVRAHEFADPLELPGEADLTSLVDFEALADSVKQQGARPWGPISQGVFLRRLGIEPRAERLKRDADAKTRADIDAALHRLVGEAPRQMGELFKAFAFTHPELPAPPGFDS
ncbi:MAG TPA: SAM-dependent methyltransferase [Xanthobacteraceae bacterium]|jgi:SAM-dependent MidA family methyltransferase|nr:SAM-dependent methyltransferase [Xanthobacteraceae bacterium]